MIKEMEKNCTVKIDPNLKLASYWQPGRQRNFLIDLIQIDEEKKQLTQ